MVVKKNMIEEIDKYKMERVRDLGYKYGLGIHLENDDGKTKIFICDRVICDIDEIGQVIDELNALYEGIEEKTGILF
jgi:hypothetical protein